MLLSIYIYFQTLSVRGANWRDEELPSPAVPWVNTGGSLEADTWVWGDLYRSEHSTGVTRPSTCRRLLIPRHKSRESWGSLGSRAESLLYRSFSCLCIFSSVVWCWNCPDHQPPSLNAEFCVFSRSWSCGKILHFLFPAPPAKEFIFQVKSDPRKCLGYSSPPARRCPHGGKLRSTWTFSLVFQTSETSVLSYLLNPVLLCPLYHPKGWNVQHLWPLSPAVMTQHFRNHSEQIHGVKLQPITPAYAI